MAVKRFFSVWRGAEDDLNSSVPCPGAHNARLPGGIKLNEAFRDEDDILDHKCAKCPCSIFYHKDLDFYNNIR